MTNIEAPLLEKRFPFDIKAVSDSGEFEGYASVYGIRDSGNEVVVAGACADTLARHKREGTMPLLLWSHNPDEPLGGWTDLAEDGKGLWGKGRIEVDAGPLERRIYTHIKRKNIRGLSIGYREVDVEPGKDGDPRKLIKIDLFEVSIVGMPMNRRAVIDGVKSESESKAIKFWARFEEQARKFRDGEPMPTKEFEEVLREAGYPRSMAVQIASVGYAKAIRSESGGEEATTAVKSALDEFRKALDGFTPPKL